MIKKPVKLLERLRITFSTVDKKGERADIFFMPSASLSPHKNINPLHSSFSRVMDFYKRAPADENDFWNQRGPLEFIDSAFHSLSRSVCMSADLNIIRTKFFTKIQRII